MASSQHVELEAAKLVQKLIQDSKDEPVELATKLYVICQHMRLSGKEETLPYQVMSRAMETVIKQHGIDINVLKSSPFPLTGVPQMGGKELTDNSTAASDMPYRRVPSSSRQAASSSQMKEEANPDSFQRSGLLEDSKTVTTATDMARLNMHIPSRQPVGRSRMDSKGLDVHEGSVSQRSSKSLEHEKPESVPMEDTRSVSSKDKLDRVKSDNQTNKKGTKKTNVKRRKADSKSRKRKQVDKGGVQGQFVVRGGDRAKINAVQHTGRSEHTSSLSSGASQSYRMKQEGNPNLFSITPNSKLPGGGEVSSGHRILKLQNRANILGPCVWNQNKYTVPLRNSQGSVSGLLEPSPAMNSGATFNEIVSEGIKDRAAGVEPITSSSSGNTLVSHTTTTPSTDALFDDYLTRLIQNFYHALQLSVGLIFKAKSLSFKDVKNSLFFSIESIQSVGGADRVAPLKQLLAEVEKDLHEWALLCRWNFSALYEEEYQAISDKMKRALATSDEKRKLHLEIVAEVEAELEIVNNNKAIHDAQQSSILQGAEGLKDAIRKSEELLVRAEAQYAKITGEKQLLSERLLRLQHVRDEEKAKLAEAHSKYAEMANCTVADVKKQAVDQAEAKRQARLLFLANKVQDATQCPY